MFILYVFFLCIYFISCFNHASLLTDSKKTSNAYRIIRFRYTHFMRFTCIQIQIFDSIGFCGLLKIKYQKYLLATPPARPERQRESGTEGVVKVLPNL